MEKKTAAPVELKRAPDAQGLFEGLATTPEVDRAGDIILAGAFTKSLADHASRGTMPAMLMGHDPARPVGRWTSFEEQDHGLVARGQLALDTADGKEAHRLLKSKAVTGLSVGFIPKRSERAKERERGPFAHDIAEADLLEVSLVAIPANAGAQIHTVKSAADMPSTSIRDFEAFLRDAGWSRQSAKALASGGWPTLQARDASGDEVERAAERLRSLNFELAEKTERIVTAINAFEAWLDDPKAMKDGNGNRQRPVGRC